MPAPSSRNPILFNDLPYRYDAKGAFCGGGNSGGTRDDISITHVSIAEEESPTLTKVKLSSRWGAWRQAVQAYLRRTPRTLP